MNHLLFGEVLETQPQFVLQARRRLPAFHQVFEEDVSHLHGTLVDCCANAALGWMCIVIYRMNVHRRKKIFDK